MKKDILAACGLVLALAIIAGCVGEKKTADGGGAAGGAASSSSSIEAKKSPAAPTRSEAVGGWLQALGSAPAGEVAGVLDKLWLAGVGFMVGGGVAILFGMKSTGANLFGVGFAMFSTGFLLMRYPWVVLIVFAAAGVFAMVVLVDQWRTRRKLGEARDEVVQVKEAAGFIAEAVQNTVGGKQVKEALKAKGEAVAAKVDAVIDPIKDALHAEGRI